MPKDRYLTVKQSGEAEITVKRSRFIATVKPVLTEEEAVAFINELKQKYWDARHNVYAYITRDNNIMRYSDDGEPAGTAGVPVLDCLKKEGLTDVLVVVTRYFGGVLLGTGGLVHAYSAAAKAGIDAAVRTEMVLCKKVTLSCAYTLWGKIQNELSKFDLRSLSPEYSDIVKIPVYVPVSDYERLCAALTEATNANISFEEGEEIYFSF